MWTKPEVTEMRFGFEVTMYVCNRYNLIASASSNGSCGSRCHFRGHPSRPPPPSGAGFAVRIPVSLTALF